MESWWRLEGRDNIYGGVTRFLRLRPTNTESDWLVVDFDSLDQLSFLDEQRPRFQLPWDSPVTDLTEDLHGGELYFDYPPDEGNFGGEEGESEGETAAERPTRPGAEMHRLPTPSESAAEPVAEPVAEPQND